MARPVLGVIACNREVEGEAAQAVKMRYLHAAITHADAAALIVPAMPDRMAAEEVVGRLDGVLLTGSASNIEGHHYGAGAGAGPHDPGRDGASLALVRAAIAAGVPLYGICRGFQEINVALGGSLRGDVSVRGREIEHHSLSEEPPAMFEHYHEVTLEPGGRLAGALGRGRITVNSVHYQGIDRLAEGLTIEARADDGLIEAFSGRIGGCELLAVQWHPEWDADRNPESRAFFAALGSAMRGKR